MRFRGRRFDTGETVSIETGSGRIVRVAATETGDEVPWVAPGFVDLQINGFGGREFMEPDLSIETVAEISGSVDAAGITAYCPTVTTHRLEVLLHSLRTLAAACEQSPEVARRVAGIHLEGPYISPEDGPRGAHPLEHCRAPNWDEFQTLQEAAGGRIRILTLSPEYDEAADFIAKVAASDVLVAIGHTSADSAHIRAAVDAGARMSTHLGNGSHGHLRRHPNYIWDQLAEDRLVASLIVDGHHLPPGVVKCFVRAKTPERCLLISDVVREAGMPPGRYTNSSVGAIEILENGRIVVAGQRQYLAGASLRLTHNVANVMRFAGVCLETAINMVSQRPATMMGRSPVRLESGAPADLVLFELPEDDVSPLNVQATINGGEVVYGAVADEESAEE